MQIVVYIDLYLLAAMLQNAHITLYLLSECSYHLVFALRYAEQMSIFDDLMMI